MPKIISERCELVKLFHINCIAVRFFETPVIAKITFLQICV